MNILLGFSFTKTFFQALAPVHAEDDESLSSADLELPTSEHSSHDNKAAEITLGGDLRCGQITARLIT